MIELLLTLGTPRRDCKDAAKAVLTRFKTLQATLEADPAELQEVPGIGPKNAFGLRLVKAVCDRYLAKKVIGRETVGQLAGPLPLPHGRVAGPARASASWSSTWTPRTG